jgi:hypothetical protein
MSSIWLSFRDCGSTSFVILLLTVVALMDAVAAAIVVFGSKARQLGIMLSAITVCLGVAVFGAGEYGQFSGRATTEQALRNGDIDPDMIERIREEGYKEAGQCVTLGIGGSALPLIFGIVLLTSAVMKKKEDA